MINFKGFLQSINRRYLWKIARLLYFANGFENNSNY